jgi:hypothetical protein
LYKSLQPTSHLTHIVVISSQLIHDPLVSLIKVFFVPMSKLTVSLRPVSSLSFSLLHLKHLAWLHHIIILALDTTLTSTGHSAYLGLGAASDSPRAARPSVHYRRGHYYFYLYCTLWQSAEIYWEARSVRSLYLLYFFARLMMMMMSSLHLGIFSKLATFSLLCLADGSR